MSGKSSATKTNIAIVITDTLRRAGLEYCLQSIGERCLVDSFDSFEIFSASEVDLYDIAYVEDSIALLNEDFFRAKKTRLIPIYTNPLQLNFEERGGLCSFTEYTKLKSDLLSTIRQQNKKIASVSTKDLSQRETEVLKEVAMGKTNKEIADFLDISMNTVMTHRKNITAKLGIKTVSGLTFYALMNGILTAEDVEQAVERDMV